MLLLQHTLKTASNLVGTVTSLMSHMDSDFQNILSPKVSNGYKKFRCAIINLDLKSEQAK